MTASLSVDHEKIEESSEKPEGVSLQTETKLRPVSLDEIPISVWLGGEPNLFDVKVEEQGIRDILLAMTADEMVYIDSDRSMPIRFFRGSKGDTGEAIKRIKATTKWFDEIGLARICKCFDEGGDEETRKRMTMEIETGYQYVRGYDAEGRAIIHWHPSAPKTGNYDALFELNTWVTYKASKCTAKKSSELNNGIPKEKFVYVVDYTHFVKKDRLPVPLLKKIFQALNDHMPERLSAIYLINAPRILRAIYAVVKHFIDPVTREKVVFCTGEKELEKFTRRVKDLHKIERFAGGTGERPFDPSEYIKLPIEVAFDE